MFADVAPKPGDIVSVRTRQYLVEDVQPGANGDQTLVRLSCLEDDAQGDPLEVLWESGVDATSRERWVDPHGSAASTAATVLGLPPHAPLELRHRDRPDAVPGPFRAGIVEGLPARAAAKGAAAAAREPVHRGRRRPRQDDRSRPDRPRAAPAPEGAAHRRRRPPSVVPQWQDELEQRFGLTFVVSTGVRDRAPRARLRRKSLDDAHPFHHLARAAARRAYAVPCATGWRFPQGSPPDPRRGPQRGSRERPVRHRLDFTRAVRELAPRFEHRLFLSATPHNGHSNSFSALLELLDPQRFCRGVP